MSQSDSEPSTKPVLVYGESLGVLAFVGIVARYRGGGIVHGYFFGRGTRVMAYALRCLGIGRWELKEWDWTIKEVIGGSAGYGLVRLQEDLCNLSYESVQTEWASSSLAHIFNAPFEGERLSLYFRKITGQHIEQFVAMLHAARLHASRQQSEQGGQIVVLGEGGPWSAALRRYAGAFGVNVELKRARKLRRLAGRVFGRWLAMRAWRRELRASISPPSAVVSQPPVAASLPSSMPRVATLYTGKTVMFEKENRSDWFWLLDNNLPAEQVLVYFERPDLPATTDKAQRIKARQVGCVALNPQASATLMVPVFQQGPLAQRLRRRFYRKVVFGVLGSLVRFRWVSWFYLGYLVRFIREYAFWRDFFAAYNVKVNVNNWDMAPRSIPMRLALTHAGGVNVSYQWSNFDYCASSFATDTDVMFSFGPAYRHVWEGNRSMLDTLAYVGYITDHAFEPVRRTAIDLRQQLVERGARFVLCYFDENSFDGRMSACSNSFAGESYRWFLTQLLEDETLGVIFKPGYPRTLAKRIGALDGLFDRALKTGRCVVMDRGDHLTEQYPAEAAQAADLCIAMLVGGTTALEAFLSGTPTVFLDRERLYWNPLYASSKGTVVFDNFDDLARGIREFRQNPSARETIGNLAQWAKQRDPFKDGRASLRMNRYIARLFQRLAEGGGREEALEYAYRQHVAEWGPGMAVRKPEWHLAGSVDDGKGYA